MACDDCFIVEAGELVWRDDEEGDEEDINSRTSKLMLPMTAYELHLNAFNLFVDLRITSP